MIGDVLGGGLGCRHDAAGGCQRRAPTSRCGFVEESGIARPEVYDWGATLPKIFEGSNYDAVVVLLGSNDRQMIKDGNLRHAFGTPEWAAAYGKQTDRILDILAGSGAAVFWVSLPPMGDAGFRGRHAAGDGDPEGTGGGARVFLRRYPQGFPRRQWRLYGLGAR